MKCSRLDSEMLQTSPLELGHFACYPPLFNMVLDFFLAVGHEKVIKDTGLERKQTIIFADI